MQHRKLDRLMTPVERIARVAAAGLTSATSSATKPSGAKSYDNADGTRTIIGNVANDESNPSYTMATHVGDVTAPGTPTGVTASSKSGVVVVEWDGTLTGGIPDDFYAVRVYLDGVELGILTGAGSVSSASLEGGTTHGVTATAEDDACLPDGTPAHNVSAPTAVISVTVSEGVESVAAIAQEALDVANATGQHFWSDSDGIHVTEVTQEEWQTTPSGANVLINSAGQLFRSVLNNLLAVLPSGIAIYDGNGNAASNILAQFTANIIRLGGKFAASGRSTAKVQFFEDASALTDLTAEHYLNTTTDPQVSHDLALSSTITDDELPDGTSRTVTGNVEVWEQVYHSGSTYSDEVTASLNGMTTNRQNNVSMGVQAIESSGASSQRVAFVTADTVRLTSGTGSQSVTSNTTMPQVRQALNCRSEGVVTMWAGTKVVTVNASSFILFTKAQLQAIVGTSWTPTGSNCSVFVMNGDYGVSANMMSASINSSSEVRVHMNATRNGALRVNYLIVRFA